MYKEITDGVRERDRETERQRQRQRQRQRDRDRERQREIRGKVDVLGTNIQIDIKDHNIYPPDGKK